MTSISEEMILIEFSHQDLLVNNRYVSELFLKIKEKNWEFVKDVIPAYNTIAVVFDFMKIKNKFSNQLISKKLKEEIKILIFEIKITQTENLQIKKIPVCYDFGIDLDEICEAKNIEISEIIQWHTSKVYQVFMLGFLPGFPYLGSVPKILEMPRKSVPRSEIVAGSVAIAGTQTGIYPQNSPGGWNIIGRTPLKIFDVEKENPCLLEQGDCVQFYEIDAITFERLNEYK